MEPILSTAEVLPGTEPIESPAASAPRAELGRSFASGVAWTGGVKWATQLITWPVTFLIARLLSPADYGFFATATVYTRLIALLAEAGIGTAVVVTGNMTASRLRQTNSLAVVLGTGALLLGCLLAFPVSLFYRMPPLAYVIITLSTVFLVDSLAVVPAALMRREWRFRDLAMIEAVRALVDCLTGLYTAYRGFAYWSLVVGYVSGATVQMLLTIVVRHVGFQRPRLEDIRDLLRTAAHLITRGISGFVYQNSDVAIAGRLLGQARLGSYTFAWTFASAPLDKLTAMVTRVGPTLFASVASDIAAIRGYLLMLLQGLSMVVFPAVAGIAIVAPEMVQVLLGQKWIGAVVPLQLLTVHAAVYSVGCVVNLALVSTGHASVVSRNGILALFLMPIGFLVLGRAFGAPGVAGAWVLLYPVVLFPVIRHTLRVYELPVAQFVGTFAPAFQGCAAMLLAVVGVRLAAAPLAPAVRLAVMIVTGVATYGAFMGLFYAARIRSLSETFRASRRAQETAPGLG